MTKKRDRLEVIYDILKAIQEKDGKIKPTHILYRSNLSHQMMDSYLKELIGKGFIREIKDLKGKAYSLEEKGYNFLERYRVIVEFWDSFGLSE